MTGEQIPPPGPAFTGQARQPTRSPGAPAWSRDAPAGALALELAAVGWHVLPLAAVGKRPLANCAACASHSPDGCGCLAAGRWCHGVRAATTDPARLAAWWRAEPAAVPAVAAGPSGLVLIDIDAHADALPPDLAAGLLPGINLTAEPVPASRWNDPALFRDGRDSLQLLAGLRGGPRPWPAGPARRPVTVTTPSGGRHLWYQAPAAGLRQALSDPRGRHGLAWQVDIKAGWSYGIAPGAVTASGTYQVTGGDPASPGAMPGWLAREIIRVAVPRPAAAPAPAAAAPARSSTGAVRYLDTVIDRGTARLAGLRDGRKRALAGLAYQAGGLLAWSGHSDHDITERLISAGTDVGLPPGQARRIVSRSLANGMARPIAPAPAVSTRNLTSPPLATRPAQK